MKNRLNIYRIYFAMLMLSASVTIILYVNLKNMESEFSNLLMLIAGFLFVAGLDFIRIQITINSSYTQNNNQLVFFNEANFYTEINQIKERFKFRDNQTSQGEHYQPNTFELVGVDNSLALAKVRMDIENELRRMIAEANISDKIQIKSAKHMTRELSSRELLPREFAHKIEEVVSVCNQAIHGIEFNTDKTMKIVRASKELLELMRRTQFNENKTAQNKA